MTDIQKKLFEMQDLTYRDFHSRLMPTIDKNVIIGVRVPILRKYAKEISKNPERRCFVIFEVTGDALGCHPLP